MTTLNTTLQWTGSGDSVLHLRTRAKWLEVARGFQLAVVGYFILLALTGPGLFIAWVALHGGPAWQDRLGMSGEADAALTVGLVLAAVGFVVCYALVILGRWLCLMHAPQRHGAKELMFCCILLSVLGPPLLLVAHFLGGARNYVVFRQGPDALTLSDFLQSGGPLQAGAVVLLGAASLLFTRFLRLAARYFDDQPRARRADLYCLLVFFAVGGLGGAFVSPYRFATLPTVLLGVGGLWAVCFLWNVALLADGRKGLLQALAKRRSRQVAAVRPPNGTGGHRPYSGMHRVLRVPK